MNGTLLIVSMLALGVTAGLLSGMFGIGGGLVIVPALVILFGLTQKQATGTSLLALLLPVGLLGVRDYWQRGDIRVEYGLLIAGGLFVGAYFGARMTHSVSDLTLKRIYAVFLILVATYYLVTTRPRPDTKPPSPEAPGPEQGIGEKA